MYVAIVIVSVCGYVSAILLKVIGNVLMPWRKANQ
jgi:hypothetical protein